MILGEDRRVRFGMCSRQGCGQLYLAIPATAWVTMEQGLSQEFNLALIGIPLLVAIGRVHDRQRGLAMLRDHILARSGPDVPAQRESEVICAVGRSEAPDPAGRFQEFPIVVLLITERGRKVMQAGGSGYEFDLRPSGALPLQIYLGAFATGEEAQAHIMSQVETGEVRDFSDRDLTFTPHTGTKR